MTDLPGFPIDPLQPPPGAYDGVARRARARRSRSALLAGGLALVVGTVGMGTVALFGGTTTGANDSLMVASSSPSAATSPSAEPTAEPTPVEATATPTRPPTAATGSPAVEPTDGEEVEPEEPIVDRMPVYLGRAVDASGKPLAGIYVWSFSNSRDMPTTQTAETAPDGTYQAPCGTKLLLTTWLLGGEQTPSTRSLAATWVGGGRTFTEAATTECTPEGSGPAGEVMLPGGTVEGEFRHFEDGREKPYPDGAAPGGGLFCDALGFTDGSGQCANWAIAGGRYRFTGLPSGTYTLLTTYTWNDEIEVKAGETTEFEWYHCMGCEGGYFGSADGESPAPAPAQ